MALAGDDDDARRSRGEQARADEVGEEKRTEVVRSELTLESVDGGRVGRRRDSCLRVGQRGGGMKESVMHVVDEDLLDNQ